MICLLPALQRTGARAKSRGIDLPIAVRCDPPLPAANTQHFARRMGARSRARSPGSPASRLSLTAPPSCPKPRGRSRRERSARRTTARAPNRVVVPLRSVRAERANEFCPVAFRGKHPTATFAGYHLPTCIPPSTCSTSPVMWRASVR
jgi:hypothetical protein